MQNCINIYSACNHSQFISIRSCTKIPTLPTLCITEKLDYIARDVRSGGSKGGARDARPPWGPKFFQFHAVFGKFWQNRMLAPPRGVGIPSSGKSWIRHWYVYFGIEYIHFAIADVADVARKCKAVSFRGIFIFP